MIARFLDEAQIPYMVGGQHRHVRQGWIGIDCPWCGSQGKWHLGIPPDARIAVCWICGTHDLARTLSRLTGGHSREIQEQLRQIRAAQPSATLGKAIRPATRALIPPGLRPIEGVYRKYIEARGFDSGALSSLWGVRSTGHVGRWRWRLWIPIYQGGELASWTTRSIGRAEPKYLHASPDQERVPIKQLLYGEDLCGDTVIVVEGPTDVWRIGPGAVCTFGMGWTDAQARRLEQFPKRIICFDNEPAAQKRAARLYERLSMVRGETLIAELEGKDPGEAEISEILELRQLISA